MITPWRNPLRPLHLKNKVGFEKKLFAKRMRLSPTPMEARLWDYLRKRPSGARFIRQMIIRGYIADFWCPHWRLVVEVDGAAHDAVWDARRDQAMQKLGIRVLRFQNREVSENIEAVLATIATTIRQIRAERVYRLTDPPRFPLSEEETKERIRHAQAVVARSEQQRRWRERHLVAPTLTRHP